MKPARTVGELDESNPAFRSNGGVPRAAATILSDCQRNQNTHKQTNRSVGAAVLRKKVKSMKTTQTVSKFAIKPAVFTAILAWLVVTTISSAAGPDCNPRVFSPNPHVFSPNTKPGGKSYGEWTAASERWLFSFPPDATNPALDETGDLAGVGQSGHVWFLPFSFGGAVTYTLTIPRGKALFIPIIGAVWVNLPELGDDAWSEEQREFARSFLAPTIDNAFNLSCRIDGVKVKNLKNYRNRTADDAEYMIDVAEDWFQPLPAGLYGPAIHDCISLIVAPLRPGVHTIHTTAASEGSFLGSISLDVTYHITVK
jgi:hypothetical protein